MIEIGAESGTSTQTNITLRNLTVDAEAQDIRCLRVCPGSQLILADGATVRNGRAINQDETTGTNDWGGGIVVDNGAKLTMEDGSSITGCSAEWGGAVYLSGEMAINGGEISNNTAVGDIYEINGVNRSASAHGGAIMIRACRADYATSYDAPAKLTMRGGTISGNAATSNVSAFGGAISIIMSIIAIASVGTLTYFTDGDLSSVQLNPTIIYTSCVVMIDRKSTRLNSSHPSRSRMPSSA